MHGLCYVALCVAFLFHTAYAVCEAGHFVKDNVCTECPAGTYQFNTNANRCIKCPVGTFSVSPGATDRVLCRRCHPGTFQNRMGASFCKPCKAGSDSRAGASQCVKCDRPGVFIDRDSSRCIRCPIGTYSDGSNPRECTSCGLLSISPWRSKSNSDCSTCPPGTFFTISGHYPPKMVCLPCHAGFYNDGTFSFCRRCPGGFEARMRGATECDPCPRGYARPFATVSSVLACERCADGFNTSGTGNVLCRRDGGGCPLNTFVAKNGDCLRCPVGYILNKSKGRCEPCGFGSISPGGLATTCTQCEQETDDNRSKCRCRGGYFFASPNGPCIPCPAGTSKISGRRQLGIKTDECVKCSPGTFSSRDGSEACERCGYGTVASEEGMTKCTKCRGGLIPDDFGKRCVSPKTNCADGFRRRSNQGIFVTGVCVPIKCGAGTFINSRRGTCDMCETGDVLQKGLSWRGRECRACPDGHISDGYTTSRCRKCPSGEIPSHDRSKCRKPCIAGQFSRNDTCEDCPAGQYSSNIDAYNCKMCKAGTVADRPGSSKCASCPAGTFSYGDGFATECLPL